MRGDRVEILVGGKGTGRPRLPGRTVTLAAMLAVGAAACGGGSTPTAVGFVSQGNAACRSADQQAGALKQPTDTTSLSQWATYLSKFVGIAQGVDSRLRSLAVPSGKQAPFSAYLGAFEASVRDAQAAQTAAAANDAAGLQSAIQKLQGNQSTILNNARSVGLTDCARGNSGSTGTTGSGTPGAGTTGANG